MAVIDLNPGSGYVPGRPYVPPPPVLSVVTDPGMGKTQEWRTTIAAPLAAQGLHSVLAVPRHDLGDEIAVSFAGAGITAYVYRGRDADDPMAPGKKMCREQERIGVIGEALGSVPQRACQNGDRRCQFYEVCGYQRQRRERPQIWIVPHNLLFSKRPDFIPVPDALGIDESFHDAGMRGIEQPVNLSLRLLKGDRRVPGAITKTVDLTAISDRVYAALMGEPSGRIRREALIDAEITVEDLYDALSLEWQRKKEIKEVYPGMPLRQVAEICRLVADHNQDVKRLTTFWELLIRTLEGEPERSPFLDLRHDERIAIPARSTAPAVLMTWRQDIHESWSAPTTIMDATMQPHIVRQYFPRMHNPIVFSASTPHTYVRQIVNRTMSASMLIKSEAASDRTNKTRQNNDDRVRKFIEVRARDVWPGRVLVVCQLDLERELKGHRLPANVETQHFNAVAGRNAWNDVALLIVIGRTEPPPGDIERRARVLFGAEIAELPPGSWYPQVKRGVRMRDGGIFAAESSEHPDPRAEAVRWSICEAGLLQAIGRGRAVNRTRGNPFHVDILTNVALPIVIDECTTWELIQPTDAEIMRFHGAVPTTYRDIVTAYPDLFPSVEAARKALARENPGQMSVEDYLISACPGFSMIGYRRVGARGPGSDLWYDPKRVNPATWLADHIGEVWITGKPTKLRTRKPKRKNP